MDHEPHIAATVTITPAGGGTPDLREFLRVAKQVGLGDDEVVTCGVGQPHPDLGSHPTIGQLSEWAETADDSDHPWIRLLRVVLDEIPGELTLCCDHIGDDPYGVVFFPHPLCESHPPCAS